MTEQEKAAFIHSLLMNENMSIPSAVAAPMAECQAWMAELAKPPLKEVKKNA